MTGWISGIKRMEIHDGDGLRTTIFFKGCPLRCLWCHNPESCSPLPEVAFFAEKCISCGACEGERSVEAARRCPTNALFVYGRAYEVEELVEEVCADAPFFKNGGGVTLSGGECTMQGEFAVALARAFYNRGISVFVDSCGYVKRKTLEDLIPYTDKFLYDLKAIDEQVHQRCTTKGNRLILDNLNYLCEKGCRVEIRYPLVTGYNDGECRAIGRYLSALSGIEKIKVLKYHRFAASRYEALGMPSTLPETETTLDEVADAVRILKEMGLPAVNGASED